MDPLQAANIALTVWDLLRGSASDDEASSDRRGDALVLEPEAPASVARDYLAMQERMNHLVFVTRAMWTLMSEKMGVTEAELLKRLTELDAAEHKAAAEPIRCSCGAAICRQMKRCLFCGKTYQAGSAFDSL